MGIAIRYFKQVMWALTCLLLIISWAGAADNTKVQNAEKTILDLAIECREPNSAESENRFIHILETLNTDNEFGLTSKELEIIYKNLFDYYIGESTGSIFLETITMQGAKLIPMLVEEKNSPVTCNPEYEVLCYKSVKERNVKVNRALKTIKDGNVWHPVFPDNLPEIAKERLEKIRIFIDDYKLAKGNYPATLAELREYSWRQYGYTLVIMDPYGKPFVYEPNVNGSYKLDIGPSM
jgi:hypothetical protein